MFPYMKDFFIEGDDDIAGVEPWEGDEEDTPTKKKGKATKIPVLAVVGRPNVGKSTIVNRIAQRHRDGSIVFDEPGVTRDRTYKRAFWNKWNFDVVDTGGLVFDEDPEEVFIKEIRQQALIALEEASAAVMVVDGPAGCTTLDEEIAAFLRRQKTPVALAVNKCESVTQGLMHPSDFWGLGLGEPLPVSGIHGSGIAEVLEVACADMPVVDPKDVGEDEILNVAIVGRPNVGKSSLLNKIMGEERAIVSDIAGTTRDTVDCLVDREDQAFRFIDTAGIRKKKKIDYGNEFFMINRALKAIRRSDVSLLVLDASDGVYEQDRTLADRIADDGRACVILLNKWDTVEKDEKTYIKSIEYVRESLPSIPWADVILVSAETGQRVNKIYDAVKRAAKAHRSRVRTSVLNEVLREAILWHAPPARPSRQQGKVYYCNQVSSRPPTIAVFCNNPKLFPDNYRRYLERKFREQLGFEATPIRFLWRGKKQRSVMREFGGKGSYSSDVKAFPKPYAD